MTSYQALPVEPVGGRADSVSVYTELSKRSRITKREADRRTGLKPSRRRDGETVVHDRVCPMHWLARCSASSWHRAADSLYTCAGPGFVNGASLLVKPTMGRCMLAGEQLYYHANFSVLACLAAVGRTCGAANSLQGAKGSHSFYRYMRMTRREVIRTSTTLFDPIKCATDDA